MKENIDIGYYTKSLDGHRQSYLDFIKSKISGERIHAKSLLGHKDAVFFLMIEENFLLYFLISLIRSMMGRKTIGLLFRPKPALEASNFRLKLKLMMLKILKKNENVKTLSIVPTPLEPSISKIVDDWIYDFQLWDINQEQKNIFHKIKEEKLDFVSMKEYDIANNIKIKASGRKIVIALGVQNKEKGIGILAENITELIRADFFVVVAGRFDDSSIQLKSILEENGVVVFDRFMSDEEILALYAVADAVWCYYDPSYDQASGILGRAIQFNTLPIVRPNSFSEKFCIAENIPHIANEPKDLVEELEDVICKKNINKLEVLLNYEGISLDKLGLALSYDREKKHV